MFLLNITEFVCGSWSGKWKWITFRYNSQWYCLLEMELRNRNEELYKLRELLKKVSLDEHSFDDDAKMLFFTGLPNVNVFKLILNYLEPALDNIIVRSINNFQKLLICLMKLRRNFSFKYLQYRFGIRSERISDIFSKVIILLEYRYF